MQITLNAWHNPQRKQVPVIAFTAATPSSTISGNFTAA